MRAFRWLFILGGVAAILVAIGITVGGVWLNTFIHSQAFLREVEARASQTMGGPVQIQAIDFNFFSGVRLRGVVTQIDSKRANGEGTLVANVESVDCTYDLRDLLESRLKLTGVTLEKPEIVLTRQPVEAVAIAAPTQAPPAGAGGASDAGGTAPFQFILEKARIHQGSLSIRNAAGESLTELVGVDAEADTSKYYEGKNLTGSLKIADVAFSPKVHLTSLSTSWIFDPHGNFITAKPMAAAGFGGNLAGDYVVDATGPSILDVNASGLDVAQIGQTANPSSPVRLSGSLNVQSKWRGIETGRIDGEGDGQLTGGKLEGVRMLQDLSAILRVEELNAPRLNEVHTHFEVENGRTRFTGLQVNADGFQMTGDGVIGQGGGLLANMVLILSRDSMARLPGEASPFFVQQPNGSGSIAFQLGGTIDHPQTDLKTRILMQGATVKNVISNALNRFFHKHNKPAPTVPPAAALTPRPEAPAAQIPVPAPGPSGQ